MFSTPFPSSLTSLLVADPIDNVNGSPDSIASPTLVNNVPVASILECQSKKGSFLLPRMTTDEINALSPTVDGMVVYDTVLKSARFMQGGFFNQTFSLATVVVPNGNIIEATPNSDIFHTPLQIIPAPGEGLIIFITEVFSTVVVSGAAFQSGGNVFLQYGNGAPDINNAAAGQISAAQIGNAVSRVFGMASAIFIAPTGIAVDNTTINQPVFITNDTAPFTNGGGYLIVNVLYTIIKPI